MIKFLGLLSKKKHWFDKKILSAYNEEDYEKYFSSNVIGTNQSADIIYLINNKQPYKETISEFKGIFYSEKINGSWTIPKQLRFNGHKTNNIHSFFMNKECDLLIISMANKKNNYDLYVSTVQDNEKWSELTNLGPTINTEKAEVTPFFNDKDNILYFSSDGRENIGNMDVFYANQPYNSWKVWTYPKSIGKKINTDLDELYFSIVGDSVGVVIKKNEYNMTNIFKFRFRNKEQNNFGAVKIINEKELEQILNISAENCIISFPSKSSYLNSDSKELLWFILNKINSKPELKIGLLYKSYSEDINGIEKKRIFEISQYLQNLGVNSESIISDKMSDVLFEKYTINDILIRLYR